MRQHISWYDTPQQIWVLDGEKTVLVCNPSRRFFWNKCISFKDISADLRDSRCAGLKGDKISDSMYNFYNQPPYATWNSVTWMMITVKSLI